MMNKEWNLNVFYQGFDDPAYQNDVCELKKIIKELTTFVKEKNQEDKIQYIEGYLLLSEKMTKLIEELYSFASLKTTTNVNDEEAKAACGSLQFLLQDAVEPEVIFSNFLKTVDLDEVKLHSPLIQKYLFNLSNIKKDALHNLSEKEEILASKLELVGSSSWGELQSLLTATLLIQVEGFDEAMPLSSVRNLAYSSDAITRKNAYIAELDAYKRIDKSVAMALNNIKREVNIMMEERGYENALQKTLDQSHMTKATLDAMIEAIIQEAPNFRRYFKLKAKALGYGRGLPFYELFAPMGKLVTTYSFDEAKELVLDVYQSFSDSLYLRGKMAFDNEWIDIYPHEGKEGGAFCANVANHDECRVLTNFTGSLGDVQTLAHELGHGYHDHIINQNDILNRNYPMPLAETASIFCQTLMSKKMEHSLTDANELLTVIENSLQEDSQCVIDILSRYLFETSVLETPIPEPLGPEKLCEMMLKAQDESYGDGLDKDYRHPYMWLCKGHYYSAGLNFYNWPYAFGLLFGKGLYKEYLKDKESFVKKYDFMLKNTALMNVEEVAQTMGIDVTKKEFWVESLQFIEEDIDLFEKILKELGMIE